MNKTKNVVYVIYKATDLLKFYSFLNFYFFEMGSYYIAQTGLEHLGSHVLSVSAPE